MIENLLAKDPNDRPSSALAVAEMLQNIQQNPEASLDSVQQQEDGAEPAEDHQSEPEHADDTDDETKDKDPLLTEKLRSPGTTGSNEISTRGLLVSLLALAAIIVVAMLVAAPKS